MTLALFSSIIWQKWDSWSVELRKLVLLTSLNYVLTTSFDLCYHQNSGKLIPISSDTTLVQYSISSSKWRISWAPQSNLENHGTTLLLIIFYLLDENSIRCRSCCQFCIGFKDRRSCIVFELWENSCSFSPLCFGSYPGSRYTTVTDFHWTISSCLSRDSPFLIFCSLWLRKTW